MAEYVDYQVNENPSLLPSSPVGIWAEAQKGSMYLKYLSSKTWSGMRAGKGIEWTGMIGMRGLAMGEGGYSGRMTMGKSISRKTRSVIGSIGEKLNVLNKKDFIKHGFFGASQPGSLGGVVGKMLGGGTPDITKFESYTSKKFNNTLIDISDDKIKPIAEKIYKQRLKKNITNLTPEDDWKKSQKILLGREKRIQSIAEKQLAKKSALHSSVIRKAALAGRIASAGFAAITAFEVGSFLAQQAAGGIESVTNRLEASLKTMFNKQMEFGGKIGAGFYGQRSGTERQRALQAMRGGFAGNSGFGSESAYSHVDSTW